MESAIGLADVARPGTPWMTIFEIVLSTPAHTDFSIPKLHVPHPSIVDGFVKHFGGLGRQWRSYRFPLPDGREFHVKEYAEIFLTHWDKESAVRNPLGHLVKDAPHWIVLGGIFPAAALTVVRRLWQRSNATRRVKQARR
jgi:hypothetical protein